MNFSELNWLGIFLGALAGFVLGALWYGPLFGKVWMNLLGISKEDGKNVNMGVLMGSSGLTYIVLAVVIAVLMGMTPACCEGGYCWSQGATIGGLVGLGCCTTVFNNALYEMKPFKLMLINGVYSILNGAIIGTIIGLI